MKGRTSALAIAVTAVMIAVTTVFTLLVRVPWPPTRGYLTLCDVAVYFSAFAFGPWVGLVAGGVGAALGDLLGGYVSFAPLTLFAHGLQGLVAGWIGYKRGFMGMVVACLAGAAVMMGLYFVGEGLFYVGWAAAVTELPGNASQNLAGAVIGIPLVLAVRRAYPPITHILGRRAWREG